MNTKHLVSGVALGALLFSPMISLAQVGAVTGARETATGRATGRVASSTFDERKAATQEKLAERRSAILQRIASRMIEHMERAIERLRKIATRIDSRIVKLKERGVNTAASEALLATARQKLDTATTAVESAKAAMESALTAADVDANCIFERQPSRENGAASAQPHGADEFGGIGDFEAENFQVGKLACLKLADVLAVVNQGDIVVGSGGGLDQVVGSRDPLAQQSLLDQPVFYGWEHVIAEVQIVLVGVNELHSGSSRLQVTGYR